jgi:hypothetical protein
MSGTVNHGMAARASGCRKAAAVALRWLLAAVLVACGGGGAPDAAPPAASTGTPTAAGPSAGGSAAASGFRGNVVLGSPTDRSVRANVFAPDQGGEVWVEYGTTPGAYDRQTAAQALAAGRPAEVLIDGLQPDTDYVYRLQFRSADGTGSGPGEAWHFHTARVRAAASPSQSRATRTPNDWAASSTRRSTSARCSRPPPTGRTSTLQWAMTSASTR